MPSSNRNSSSPLDLAVVAHGVGDVAVDVVLGRARREERGGLLAVDRAPREQGALLGELRRPPPGLREGGVPVAQRLLGLERRQVGEDVEHVGLHVPEVVAVVALTGETLGRDPVVVGEGRGLQHLEQGEPHRLAQRVVADDVDVALAPELVEPVDLGVEEVLEGELERLVHPVGDALGHGVGVVVGAIGVDEVLAQVCRLAGAELERVGAVDPRAVLALGRRLVRSGDLEDVVGEAEHRQLGPLHPMTEADAIVLGEVPDRTQHLAPEGGHLTGVVGLAQVALVGHQLRRELDGHGVGGLRAERLDLVLEARQVRDGERDQPAGPDRHPPARGRLPHDLAADEATAEVEDPVVLDELARAHVEDLAVDGERDHLAVGDVQHGLVVEGETVGGLGIDDRARLVEAVEVGPPLEGGRTLLEVAAQTEVAVGQREDGLALGQRIEVEVGLADVPTLDRVHRRGTDTRRRRRRLAEGSGLARQVVGPAIGCRFARTHRGHQLREVLDHDVGAVLTEGLGLVRPVDPDDEPEVTGPTGLHPREGVLEDHTPCHRHREATGRLDEGVGGGLAADAAVLDVPAVDADVELVGDPGGLDHGLAVLARRDHRGGQAELLHVVQEADRTGERRHPVGLQQDLDELVLAVPEAVDGECIGRVLRGSVGEGDRPRREEAPHPVVAGLAVEVVGVVAAQVERHERLVVGIGPGAQELVEHLPPRGGMEGRRVGQHSVEIEQNGAVVAAVDETGELAVGVAHDPPVDAKQYGPWIRAQGSFRTIGGRS